jgi:flagella basal body P-ring formation protein FlgA
MRSRLILLLRAVVAALGLGAMAPLGAATAPEAMAFTREQVLAALTREVTAHYNLEGELQLELLRPWTPPARAAGAWTLSVLEFPSVLTSSMLLRCRITAEAAPAADFVLSVRASLWRDAWMARQPLNVGAPFDADLLEARRTDLLRDRDVLPASAGDRSYAVIRAVAAGRMLTWRDISRRPLVRKGELVEVSAIDGVLFVTLKALAMENGARGETVTLRNPESRRNFSAVVVDENRVQVRF